MTELLEAILAARDRVLMLLILTVAVLLVTYIIYTISGRSGIIKYLPGLLLTGAGVYYLYLGLQQMTTQAGLNELMSSVMFIVIGLIGISFALILGILHQGEGQKTKRRAQALDYLQEARSAEAVVYPKRKEAEEMLPAPDPEALKQQEEQRKAEEAEHKKQEAERQRLREAQEQERKEKEEAEHERQEALRKEREREQQRVAALHADLLKKEETRHGEERAQLLAAYEKRGEDHKLARLEEDLNRKNAIRERVRAYNARAEEVNRKKNAGFADQLGLFGLRAQIRLHKWAAAALGTIGDGLGRAGLSVSRGTKLATTGTEHAWRSFMTRYEARKKPEDASSDPDREDPTA